jgi:hypothetical protein
MICMMEDCPDPVRTRGYCNKHYLRLWKYGSPYITHTTYKFELLDRLAANSQEDPETGCVVWQLALTKAGYARIEMAPEKRKVFVHRIVYELNVGPIPEGMVIDHLCRNRACINYEHLEVVTIRENTLRGEGASAENAKKIECRNGHEFTDDNIQWVKGKYGPERRCKECTREVRRRGKEKKKGKERAEKKE